MKTDVTIRVNYRGLSDIVSFRHKDMRKIANKARKLMRNRISSGKDVYQRKFEAYSDSYRNYKRKLGKDPYTVNMEDSGKMINSLRTNVMSGTQAEIYPTLHTKIGEYHQLGTARGGKKRRWFGFSTDSQKELTQFTQSILNNKIKRFERG